MSQENVDLDPEASGLETILAGSAWKLYVNTKHWVSKGLYQDSLDIPLWEDFISERRYTVVSPNGNCLISSSSGFHSLCD